MLNDVAEYSTENYAKLSEDIDNKLHGVTASRDDEFTWMTLTQNMLPWDFAKIYVEKYFSESNKKDVREFNVSINPSGMNLAFVSCETAIPGV